MSSDLQDEEPRTFQPMMVMLVRTQEVHVDVTSLCIGHIHRIPPHVRGDSGNHGLYDPVVVSIGPYRHGKRQYCHMEKYKEVVLKWSFRSGSEEYDKAYEKIFGSIDAIRSKYNEKVEFDDKELADIIIRDACFIAVYMDRKLPNLGLSTAAFIEADICMLENQIPFWVIMLLLGSLNGEGKAREIVHSFISTVCCNNQLVGFPWENGPEEPIHLLEVYQRTCARQPETVDESTKETKLHFLTKMLKWKKNPKTTSGSNNNSSQPSCETQNLSNNNSSQPSCETQNLSNNNSSQPSCETQNLSFRSVTNLQSHGIYFEPSSSCLKDIRFTSYPFYGKLLLPIWCVSPGDKFFFSNIIAFEMSGGKRDNCTVSSYINFMKSLIENSKDVKELRKNGILSSRLGNDEDVVKLFKELNTFGLGIDSDIFVENRRKIEKHCTSKARTWMAELLHIYFRSPWTTAGVFAAAFLFCLTILQTYYTIRPRN